MRRNINFPGYHNANLVYQDEAFALYRAHRAVTGAEVFIKTPAAKQPSEKLLHYFEHEMQLADVLDAQWAIRPLAIEQFHGGPALVLEGFTGNPLNVVVLPLDLTDFLTIAVRTAAALAAMHAQDLVHKDLKPANIFVADGGKADVRLSGFTIAARLGKEPQPPRHPEWLEGTLAYMPPEQTGRINRRIDYRADLYSLGVVYYQLITGVLPCEGTDVLGWLMCQIAVQPVPPCEQIPEIPRSVSDIIMKLLAKDPNDRYQSAEGLQIDLEHCLADWNMTGEIAPFPLGACDISERFLIPQKLYGREAEIAALEAAYSRIVEMGNSEIVLVSGYAGIGKTVLVQQLYSRVLQDRGFLLTGKFDQLTRDIPYAAIIQAFSELVDQLLGESEERLAKWRQMLQDALGSNGQLLIDIIPNLAVIIGPQPAVVPLPPTEARNRFHLLMHRFVGVFARPAHPLVIFLDDLQWADSSSLALIEYLSTRTESRTLLLIGAYRDTEVSSVHPLMLILVNLRQAGVRLQEIVLSPLAMPDMQRLVADTLHDVSSRIAPLTELVYIKTGGNPFFFIQFLKGLYQDGLLRFDRHTAQWIWNLEEMAVREYSDNVVDFMISKLALLPQTTRHVLQRLASIGSKSDLLTLAAICEMDQARVEQALDPAVAQGMMIWNGDSAEFVHDRVQQAAYEPLPPDERHALHLKIGRLLLARFSGEALPEHVFEIVSQFNRARPLLVSDDERVRVAELNLLAGRKAKASTAYQSALTYLTSGLALLTPASWCTHYALTFGLHAEAAECEWLSGNLENAYLSIQGLLDRSEIERLDRARLYRDLIEVNTTRGQMQEAIRECRQCLVLFDQNIFAAPTRKQMQEAYDVIWQLLGAQPIEALLDLPRMTDLEIGAVMDAMAATIPAAVFTSETFLGVLLCRMVALSIRYGNGESSLAGYTYFGMIAGQTFGNYQVGYRFGKLAINLVERGFLTWKSRVMLIFGNVINFWTNNIRTNIPYIHAAFAAGLELGDLANACYCCNHLITTMLAVGTPLPEVYAESERRLAFVKDARYNDIADILISQQRFILNMQGRTNSFLSFSDADFDERAFEQKITQSQMALLSFWYGTLRLQAHVVYGDFAEAIARGYAIKDLLWTSPSHIENTNFTFYYALALAAGYAQAPDTDREAMWETMEAHRAQLEQWAQLCPQNFQYKYDLIMAELASLTGDVLQAEEFYERAIRAARANDFTQDIGLAFERTAHFYRERGLGIIADSYLREARYYYLRWGAEGKTRQMESQYPMLGPRPSSLFATDASRETLAAQTAQLDLLAVIKASQAVAGEIVLSKLLDTILTIVMESAGATHAYLLLPTDSDATIAAEANVVAGNVIICQEISREAEERIPRTIINYAIRTQETVIIDDVSLPSPFADALLGKDIKSLLCLPIIRQQKLVAILYLENNLLTGVFTPDRSAFLELLATQAAISIENARLYGDLHTLSTRLLEENRQRQAVEVSLAQLNAELEKRVAERTVALEAANKEMEAFTYSVSHDLRAPLRAVDGFSKAILEDYADRLDEKGREYLAFIREGAQQMGKLIDDLLRLSRVGRTEMRMEPVNLSALVREVAEDLRRQEPDRMVEWRVEPDLTAVGDQPLLRIMLENLLGNAWKFTGKRPIAHIEFFATLKDGETVYVIRDNGAGFDMHYVDKIFAPFQRLHSADEFPGTGIGLAIVQRVINRHGGRVWAEGAVDQGATFYFTLPKPQEAYNE